MAKMAEVAFQVTRIVRVSQRFLAESTVMWGFLFETSIEGVSDSEMFEIRACFRLS